MRSSPRRTALSCLLCALLCVAALSCASCGGKSEFSKEQQKKLESVVDRVISEYGLPGMVVLVSVPGEGTWKKAKGKADVDSGQAMKLADKFRVASVTKTFTATVALQLVDEKKLGFDDRVDKYVKGVPGIEGVTVRQLLNHTSGLHEFTDTEAYGKANSTFPPKKWKPEELVMIGVANPPYFAPGKGFHYSNTNYVLLGMVIEKAAGGKFADELEKRVLDPLKLGDTSMPEDAMMTGEYSHGYWDYNNDGKLEDFTSILDPSATWSAGAMVSNADDLAKWAGELAGGKLLSKETQAERLELVKADLGEFPGAGYGLGIMEVDGYLGHDGATPGYNSAMFYLPEKDAAIVVLTNKYTEAWKNAADRVFLGIEDALDL